MDNLATPLRHGAMVEDEDAIREIITHTRTIAVLGIKPEALASEPAHYVPKYLIAAGFEIIPVPVLYPEARVILGRRCFRSVREIPYRVDLVCLFRRPADIPPHIPDLLAARPRAVWFQSGIRHDVVAARLARAGIDVVQDRCLMIDYRKLRAL